MTMTTTTLWETLGIDQHSALLAVVKWGGIAVTVCINLAADPAQMTALPHGLMRLVQIVATVAALSAATHQRSPLA